MESNNNEIYFNFSYYALNLLGKQMYTNKWSAISELVANGLDADASIVRIYINSTIKDKSTIEIFDNGSGMSYFDLANKYALIGRNKRQEDSEISDKVKGRKGVGKLAGLFLSKKYYIITKNKGIESAWVLDSKEVKDSDLPKLDKIDVENVRLESQKIWDTYSQGTLIKLTDVDMTNFAEKKLDGLKRRIADYYLLDELGARIEVAYVTNSNETIDFQIVTKEVAFKNFYAFFESEKNLKSKELSAAIPIKNSGIVELDDKKRNVILLTPETISSNFAIKGKKEFIGLDGGEVKVPYELKGWIGIHATINSDEARLNDTRFMKNEVYSPNRLKLYVRDKLAVENFLEYLNNNQAFSNYIEGEISFDVLDDDRLPDISTTSREGLSKDDERVQLLIDILKIIVNKLIRERINIRQVIKGEADAIYEQELENQKAAKQREQKAKEEERKARKSAEEHSQRLNVENRSLKDENMSLSTQNKMKDILLNESDPTRQTLLVHELTGVSNQIDYVIDDMAEDFFRTEEYTRIAPYLADLKKSSDKLTTIKQQILKLNDYDIIGKQNIDLKGYLRSYFENIHLSRTHIKIAITSSSYLAKVEIFELGVLLDNLVSNAVEREASFIEVIFSDAENEFHVISDTGPIEITPIDNIFNLGVSSKKNGTGIGMYLSKEICEDFGWTISARSQKSIADFTIKLGAHK